MPQAQGAQGRFTYVQESAWGVTPGSPAMKLLKAAVYGESLGGDIEELISNSINSNRAVEAVRGGKIDVKGAIPIEAAALGLGTIFKNILGSNTTTGAGPYVHTMKRGALPAGLTLEKGFTDLAQYFKFTGIKINAASLNINATGLVTGSLDVVGKDVAVSGTSLGSPTSVAHTPFVSHEAVCQEGGGAATLLSMSINITNNIDAPNAVGSRYVVAATEGRGETTGEIVVMFDSLSLFNKWLNETSSSLQVTLTNGSNSLDILLPNIRYVGDAVPKIANAQGVVVPLRYRAIYDGTEATDIKLTLTNTEATV